MYAHQDSSLYLPARTASLQTVLVLPAPHLLSAYTSRNTHHIPYRHRPHSIAPLKVLLSHLLISLGKSPACPVRKKLDSHNIARWGITATTPYSDGNSQCCTACISHNGELHSVSLLPFPVLYLQSHLTADVYSHFIR
jgi:hypothetical protein